MAIQKRRRTLPAELIGVICTHCDAHTLARLALVSKSVHYEALRVLYRDLVLHRHLSSSRKRSCIQSLLNDHTKASRVRALTYHESCVVPLQERAEIIRLLVVLLKRATTLRQLDLWIYPETDVQALKAMKATSLPSLRRFATNMPLGPDLVSFLSSHRTLQAFNIHHRIGTREIKFYSSTFADLAESRAAQKLPPLSIFSNHSERDYGYCYGASSRGRNVLFAFPHASEEPSLIQNVSYALPSIRSALEMGPMDMVALYLDVDFTISLKGIVALLQPLQLVFDAVREFVIYVPRGREIILKGQSVPRRTCYVVPKDHYPGFLLD
ncbi:hypothetical protein BDM02DRAFT_3181977 [Thelephora ganbajun]|uniref:Uncharacterized protein n=1 Tax=Thelephora ganbajun TaxID=370292 RepID=A0ACB6ZX19_THEGA|nr:hypothetical protein BDM02DRAFT_3181977 [Thelephora ganbajun]